MSVCRLEAYYTNASRPKGWITCHTMQNYSLISPIGLFRVGYIGGSVKYNIRYPGKQQNQFMMMFSSCHHLIIIRLCMFCPSSHKSELFYVVNGPMSNYQRSVLILSQVAFISMGLITDKWISHILSVICMYLFSHWKCNHFSLHEDSCHCHYEKYT